MDDKNFEKLVKSALKKIPREFKQKLNNIDIVIEDLPNSSQIQNMLARGEKGILLGLYEGIPLTERRSYGIGGPLPDKISIFKLNILRISRNLDDVERLVRDTVIHEIGHRFGLSDEKIEKIQKSKDFT